MRSKKFNYYAWERILKSHPYCGRFQSEIGLPKRKCFEQRNYGTNFSATGCCNSSLSHFCYYINFTPMWPILIVKQLSFFLKHWTRIKWKLLLARLSWPLQQRACCIVQGDINWSPLVKIMTKLFKLGNMLLNRLGPAFVEKVNYF